MTATFWKSLRPNQSAPNIHKGDVEGGRQSQVEKITSRPSLSQDEQLKRSENAWRPAIRKMSTPNSKQDDEDAELLGQFRSILNKVTPQNFTKLMDQIMALPINTEERLKGVIDLIHDKAIMEPVFSRVYANVCRVMQNIEIKDSQGNAVQFRSLIIRKCQGQFERQREDDQIEEEEQRIAKLPEEERAEVLEEFEHQLMIAKKQRVGNIRLVGELFKLQLLTEKIIQGCIFLLLKAKDDESLECVCELTSIVGQSLDHPKSKALMDRYFRDVDKIITAKKVSYRVWFMLQDLKDHRLNNWEPRRKEAKPMMLDQIRKEAEQEVQGRLAAQFVLQPPPPIKVSTSSMEKNQNPSKLKITRTIINDNGQLGPGSITCGGKSRSRSSQKVPQGDRYQMLEDETSRSVLMPRNTKGRSASATKQSRELEIDKTSPQSTDRFTGSGRSPPHKIERTPEEKKCPKTTFMASASSSEEEILLCCICLETLEEPKILGCLHRFCKKCLAKVINNVPDGGDSFQCPTCRHNQSLPKNGLDGISNDFLLHDILEYRKLEQDIRSKKKNQTCGSCKRFTTVMAICPHCEGFICETCHTGHTLMKTFEDHTHMVTLKDIETGKVSFDIHRMKSVGNTPKCPSHKDMTLHINCRTCEQLICPVCAPLHHQNHEFEEIHIAAKRVKEKIGGLVEESEKNARVLEKSVDEIKEIRSRYGVEIDGIRGQIKTIAQTYEEDIQRKKQSDLKELEQKRRSVEQKASEDILAISREKAFVEDEIQMVAAFVQHSLDQVETEKLDTIRKVKDCQTTTGILTKDVDDWSLLKAAPDIQKVLDVEQEGTNIQHLRETSVKFQQFLRSPLNNQCWKKWHREGTIQVRKNSGYTNLKIYNIRRTRFQSTLSINTAGDGVKTRYYAQLPKNILYSVDQSRVAMEENKGKEEHFRVHVHVPDTNENIFHVWDFAGFALSVCNKAASSSIFHDDRYLKDIDIPAKVSCCTYFPQPPNERVLLGVENSTTLYKCDVNGNLRSNIPVIKEDGLKPPVSLSVANAEMILLCDGESKALAIGVDGEVIARFVSKCPTDNPMAIASDADKFVYVLWDTVAGAQQLQNIKTGVGVRDRSHATDGNDDGDNRKVVQYTIKGVYISEVYVDWRMDLMTTMTDNNNGEVIVLASNDGIFQCFDMTPFGREFSKFVQDRDISEAANNGE